MGGGEDGKTMGTDKTRLTVAKFNRMVSERMPFAGLIGLRLESLSGGRAVHRDEFLWPGRS